MMLEEAYFRRMRLARDSNQYLRVKANGGWWKTYLRELSSSVARIISKSLPEMQNGYTFLSLGYSSPVDIHTYHCLNLNNIFQKYFDAHFVLCDLLIDRKCFLPVILIPKTWNPYRSEIITTQRITLAEERLMLQSHHPTNSYITLHMTGFYLRNRQVVISGGRKDRSTEGGNYSKKEIKTTTLRLLGWENSAGADSRIKERDSRWKKNSNSTDSKLRRWPYPCRQTHFRFERTSRYTPLLELVRCIKARWYIHPIPYLQQRDQAIAIHFSALLNNIKVMHNLGSKKLRNSCFP